jgi:tRNA uridine 5-carboxymethylaminomethyl modification enzyme
LTELSYRLGLASQERMDAVIAKKEGVEKIKNILNAISLDPIEADGFLIANNSSPLPQKQKAVQLLLRPTITLDAMLAGLPKIQQALAGFEKAIVEQAEIQIKYDVYIEKEKELVKRMNQLEDLIIPENFNYDRIASLSAEAMQKFKKIKPRTLGQASRISGVNPSDVQILMVYMGR